MSNEAKTSSAALVLAGAAFVAATTLMPTHVTLGAGSLRCGTVIRPDRVSEIAHLCGRAGANQLHTAALIDAVLVAIATVPIVVRSVGGRLGRSASVLFLVAFLIVAAAGTASLGVLEYSPRHAIFDL